MGAINMLNSILASGASKRTPNGKAVAIPPPAHIALLNTLAIHPLHTNRAEKPDNLDVSSLALEYLRNLLATVGPLNAGFRTAFQFNLAPKWGRRSGASTHGHSSDVSDGEDDDDDRLKGKLANGSSIWSRGRDFWSTVGWAFNCSALYPQRWRYWKTWLEYMLDVLDADWKERERCDLEVHDANGKVGEAPVTSRQESMIVMYMNQQNGRQGGFKAIIKALLADGGSLSSTSFQEVFDKELRGPKASKKRKRDQALDLENDKFGDYFDDESISSGVSEPPTPQKPRDGRPEDDTLGSTNPGLAESTDVRLRLFGLISGVTYALRTPKELTELYDDFAAAIKVLPLQMFSLLVSQRANPLLIEPHTTITKELFHLLLPSSYKDPRKVDPKADMEGSLTSLMVEECYIGYPANTVGMEDNAKLSLVVENAIQILWLEGIIEYTDKFAKAAIKGIEARDAKAKKKRTGKLKTEASDALAQEMLANSGSRIRALLEVLEASAGSEA